MLDRTMLRSSAIGASSSCERAVEATSAATGTARGASSTTNAPAVPVSALTGGEALGRLEVLPGEVRDREERHLRDGLRDVQDIGRLGLEEQMVCRPRRTDATGTQCQHEGPDRRQDGAVERRLNRHTRRLESPLDAGDDQDRHLLEMVP